ncbi:MAG: glycosyltransferase [Anaerolineae bacterium]|nr:glycosyltransferase [Anaerolineae bacterium]
MMIHVVLFTLSLRSGGTERQVANLAQWLDRQRYRVTVVVIFPDHTPLMDELIAAGIPVYADWFAGGKINYVRGIFRFAAYLRSQRVQIVHTFLIPAYLFSLPAAILAGVRARIVSIRMAHRPLFPNRAWLYRLLLRFNSLIEVNAEATGQLLIDEEHITPERIVIHRNAIRLEQFDPPPSIPDEAWVQIDRIRIGTVGNIHPFKNPLLLAQAAADLLNDYPNIDVIHVGGLHVGANDPVVTELRAFTQSHLGDHWTALGKRNDVPSILRALDIFVMTSNVEATSNAMLEAMASGLPVISTDVGDAKAILSESGGGIVVPVGDRAALAGALRRLIDNPDLRKQMGEANRQWALANLSPERLARQVEAMYELLLRRS